MANNYQVSFFWKNNPSASFFCFVVAVVCIAQSIGARGDVVVVEGGIRRQAFEPDGKVFLDKKSHFSYAMETNSQAQYIYHLRWTETPLRWEEYWLGGDTQRGLIASPILQLPNSTNPPSYNTDAVIAKDIQPRLASTELQAATLSLLDSNRFSYAVQRGIIPPWGDERMADLMCCRAVAEFSTNNPYFLTRVQFIWNEECWRDQLSKLGRKDSGIVKPPVPDKTLVGEMVITKWDNSTGLELPAEWSFERFSQTGAGKTFVLESVSYRADRFHWSIEKPSPSEVPPNVLLHDFRASGSTNRGLALTYSSTKIVVPLDEGSTNFQRLKRDATFHLENAKRSQVGLEELGRDGQPKHGKQNKRVVVALMLLLPALAILPWLIMRRRKLNKQTEPTNKTK